MAKKATTAIKDITPEAAAVVDTTAVVDPVAENTELVTPVIEPIAEVSADIASVLSDIQALSDDTETPVDTEVRVKKSKLDSADLVPCKSLFHGKLIYTSPINGAKWVWKDYGTIVHVPMRELETMNNQKPVFLNRPLIVILEASVIEDFNFGETYRKVASLSKLGVALKTGTVESLRGMVRDLVDVGMRESVIAEARKQRKENTLVNVNVINMLNSELKTNIG